MSVENQTALLEPLASDANSLYRSGVLDGLWINVNWLWQEPPPKVLPVLREWKLI